MENGLYVGLSHQVALSRSLAVVANNLANLTTTGFQGDTALFATYLNRSGRETVAQVEDFGLRRDTAAGPLTVTDNPLDVALIGPGYLTVQRQDGSTALTRAGSLTRNAEGQLITQTGAPVLSADGAPLQIPAQARRLQIGGDGTVRADGAAVGRLGVVEVADDQRLERLGDTQYRVAEGQPAPTPATLTLVRQGMLEGANVNAVRELTRMIEIQRAYEATSGMLDREAQKQSQMIQTLTRV